jgi:hypothetical protein
MGAGCVGPRTHVRRRAVAFAAALAALTQIVATARADWNAAQDRFWGHIKDVALGPVRLDIGGRLRLRQEHDDAFTVKGYVPDGGDDVLLQRLRLDLDFRLPRAARVFLQFQDAHAHFTRYAAKDFPRTNPYEDWFDLRQAFVEWTRIGGSPFGFKVGRQAIAYGDERVFGPGDWGNTGRYSWDAAILKVDTSWLWAELWLGRFMRMQPDAWPNSPFTQPTLYVAYAGIKRLPFRLDLFYAARHDTSGRVAGESGQGDLLTHSFGFQLDGRALRQVEYGLTLVAQLGAYGADRVRAFGASAKLGVTLPLPWTPRLVARFTWGSGDSDPHDGVHETFDGIVGGVDIQFYGYANLFSWSNLRDHEVNLHLHPHRALQLRLEYHYFTLDEPRGAWFTTSQTVQRHDPLGRSGVVLGHELDAALLWRPLARLQVALRGAIFFPVGFVERTGPSRRATWASLEVTYAF